MNRIIEPSRGELGKLRRPPSAGMIEVINLFDARLPREWEIYVRPHLNGLRPDIVLINPSAGIAVFDVDDGDVESIRSSLEIGRTRRNPITRMRLYKDEILNLYCPRLNDHFGKAGVQAITTGIICPQVPTSELNRVFTPFLESEDGIRQYPQYYPVSGADDIASGNLAAIFPEYRRTWSKVMSANTANDLRGWLTEPAFSREQRKPLDWEMDNRQLQIAKTRTVTGYRRVKGPAGSGKSLALAARAAELANEGLRVLVCTFNITIGNYLRDLALRYTDHWHTVAENVDFLHFHAWCKRVCVVSGYSVRYGNLWANQIPDDVLERNMAELVCEIYDCLSSDAVLLHYDAILVDEGQDFRPLWWQTLLKAVANDGEKLLVADKTQDIYGKASAWTDEAMIGAGFRGEWLELKESYRLPPAMIPRLEDYVNEFLSDMEVDIPTIYQPTLNSPAELRWLQVEPDQALRHCVEEMRRQMIRLRSDTAIPDVVFLSSGEMGRALVDEFERMGARILHTFDVDGEESRRQKLAFFQGSSKVKATTVHSFKGWEGRHLIIYADCYSQHRNPALLYTALTRLKAHPGGSALTVVSDCTDLRNFGSKWPDFADTVRAGRNRMTNVADLRF